MSSTLHDSRLGDDLSTFRRGASNPMPMSRPTTSYTHIKSHRIRRREKVYLNIYNLTPANAYLRKIGYPVYHSSVEIYGVEFAFGGHPDSTTGIFETKPFYTIKKGILPETLTLYESRCVGSTAKTYAEISEMLEELADKWPGNSYDLLTRNCNNFSDVFLRLLIDASVPSFVNRIARLGDRCSCCLPSWLAHTDWQQEYNLYAGLGRRVGGAPIERRHPLSPPQSTSERRNFEDEGSARQMAELAALRRLAANPTSQLHPQTHRRLPPVLTMAAPRARPGRAVAISSSPGSTTRIVDGETGRLLPDDLPEHDHWHTADPGPSLQDRRDLDDDSDRDDHADDSGLSRSGLASLAEVELRTLSVSGGLKPRDHDRDRTLSGDLEYHDRGEHAAKGADAV